MLTRFQRVRAKVFLTIIGIIRHMTIGTKVMLIDGNKVFLIKHTLIPGWQFPGGGIEPGETAEASAARETLEETGHRVTGPMELFGVYHNTSVVTNRDHVLLYIARQHEFAFERKKDHEIAECGWFEITKLPDGVTPATSQRIDEVFDCAPKRDVWGY